MAHHQHTSFGQNRGQQVHTGNDMAVTATGVWDAGKMVDAGVRAAAPIIEGNLSTAALL